VKKKIVRELEGLFEGMSDLVVVGYRGVSGREMAHARRELRKAGVEVVVVKNRLAKLAFESAGMERMGSLLNGPSAVVFGGEEGVLGLAKMVAGWKKRVNVLEMLGGACHGSLLSPGDVARLSRLASLDRIRADLVVSLGGPATSLVGTLQQLLAWLVYALDGIKEKQEASAQAG